MVLMEDMQDALLRWSESRCLNILDGRDWTRGVVFVATTNHMDRFPDRIANLPLRFDVIIKVRDCETAFHRS